MNNFFKTDFNLPSFSSINNDGSGNNNNNNNNNNSSTNNVNNTSNSNFSYNNTTNTSNSNNYNSNGNNSSNNSNNPNSSFNSNNNNPNNNFNNSPNNGNNSFNNNPNTNTNTNNNDSNLSYNPNSNSNFNNNPNNGFNSGFSNNNNGNFNTHNNNGNYNTNNNHFNTYGNNSNGNNNYNNTNHNFNGGNGGYNGKGNNNTNNNHNYGSGNNGNSNNNYNDISDSNTGVNSRPQQGMFPSPDYGQQQQQQQQQHQLPSFSFQPMQNQQYQQHGQQQQFSQQPYQQQQPSQQQQQQRPYGSSDNYRPLMSSDIYGGSSNPHPLYRSDMGQDGPIRSQPRGTPLDNGHSVRFNPSRNYTVEALETSTSSGTGTGTFLARPKIPGLPCIACNMSRTTCDGGSPCRSCLQNRVRCHYEGDNNTRFFEIEALQFDEPLSGSQSSSRNRDNRDNLDSHDGRAPPVQAGSSVLQSSSPSFTASSPPTGHSSQHPASRSRSCSGSGSVGSGSGSGSGASLNAHKSHDYMRISPVMSSPIMLSDQSLISIPPFHEVHQDQAQHSRVTLPSISSMGPVTLISSVTNTRTSSSAKGSGFSASSRSSTSFSSSDRDSSSGPSASSNKAGHDRSNLSSQNTPSSRTQTERGDAEIMVKRALSKKQQQQQNQSHQKHQQPQQHQQAMPPKDPLYSLSSASIRARKNALEMENIQRASHLYSDYISKIKDLSVAVVESTPKTTPTYLSEHDLKSYNKMDVYAGSRTLTEHAMATSSPRGSCSNLGENTPGPVEGLIRMSRSGMLHSLVQQYFTLIHPQFMVLHKNRFLVRFWRQYGSFPEANELQSQVVHNAKATNIWRGPVNVESGKPEQEESEIQPVCLLLLLAMLALVSRHLSDRAYLKSSAADKQQRVEHSLALLSKEFQDSMNFMLSNDKTQEARLFELMEAQDPSGEGTEDRGEQYFQWASELLKAKYEEPSLTVVQSLLLLREYAIMSGNHTQAYMYGGTAITMAMGLGWHHAGPTKSPGQGDQPLSVMDLSADASNEGRYAEPEEEESKELKLTDEEQKLCWWHCFIADRWMSAIHNRPVNIPIHIFDKTLLPLPKAIRAWDSKENNGPQAPMNVFTSTNFTDPKQSGPEALSHTVRKVPIRDLLSIGSGVPIRSSPYLPSPHYRAKAFFDQQCRQALILDDILSFLSSWSDDLFVSSVEFEKLSQSLDDWHQALADWQTFPITGIVGAGSTKRQHGQGQKRSNTGSGGGVEGDAIGGMSTINADEGRDVVQATLLGISYHTIRILLYRPFLRTNMRHPPCLPSRASAACAQSANAMTSLAEYLVNQTDMTVQPCLLMRHQFSLVTAAGIQQMNSNLDEEPRLSTPAKINLLKTIRILRDADRSSWGTGVEDGLHQVLRELFPAQMKHMWATA